MVTIFHLFKVASVAYISYTRYSDAILWQRKRSGTISSGKKIRSFNQIQITEKNSSIFINFYKGIANILPTSLYALDNSRKDLAHLTIAYKHYCVALLTDARLEEKIMNAVIGLESLLLAEKQEIAFRFYVRSAKILGLLNYSSMQVKKILKIAYDIRSTFVHGDDVELQKELNKLDGEQQSPPIFLEELLNYFRVLIITTVVISQKEEFIINKKDIKNFNKKKLLSIVDDFLIDKEKEAELNSLLDKAKELLQPIEPVHASSDLPDT